MTRPAPGQRQGGKMKSPAPDLGAGDKKAEA
jgi:hypothetical protein